MSNLSKFEFIALDITGKKKFTMDNVEMHLEALTLTKTIQDGNKASPRDRAKASIFLHRYLNKGLKYEYMNVKDQHILWKDLKDKFDHQKAVILLNTRKE